MEIVKEFGINPILLLAQIVNFTILLFLLKKFLYKPILKVLEERKTKIAKSLKQAEEIEKRLEQSTMEQEKVLNKARSEANQIVSQSKKEAKELSEKTVEQAKVVVTEMLEKNQERLKLEKEQMMIEVKKDLADLVVKATKIVSSKTLTKEDNDKMVSQALKEVENEQ